MQKARGSEGLFMYRAYFPRPKARGLHDRAAAIGYREVAAVLRLSRERNAPWMHRAGRRRCRIAASYQNAKRRPGTVPFLYSLFSPSPPLTPPPSLSSRRLGNSLPELPAAKNKTRRRGGEAPKSKPAAAIHRRNLLLVQVFVS
ncbi:hypothetical protein MTO96_014582 [Rhipicephalus appendiculatus]